VSNASTKKSAVYAAINFTPDKAGAYTFLFWDDVNRDGALGGATEKYTTVTFTAVPPLPQLRLPQQSIMAKLTQLIIQRLLRPA